MRSNALEPRFHGVRHDGYLAWPSLLPGSAAMPFCRRSFCVSGLLSGRFRVPFCCASGRAADASFRCQARPQGRPGEAASPAAASRGGTLGVTARLPDATDSPVTNGKVSTTLSHSSRWPADVEATARGCRGDGRARAYQIRKRRAGSFRITEFWMFAQLRGLINGQKTLLHGH